ncbi:hypothetical protein PT2222_180013 [Paraburkholderia tropica]
MRDKSHINICYTLTIFKLIPMFTFLQFFYKCFLRFCNYFSCS